MDECGGPMEDDLSDCLLHLDSLDTGTDGDQEMPFLSYLEPTSTIDQQQLHSTTSLVPLSVIPDQGPYCVRTPSPNGRGRGMRKWKGKHCASYYLSQNQQPEGNYPAIETDLKSPETRHTPNRPTSSAGRQLKTPRTLMKLQEKHRESERVRHHTLNKSMKSLCSKVPGYDEKAKETKVVMLQRVVDYICDLEHNVQGLCDEMGIKLDLTNTFLTTKMKEKKDSAKRQGCSRSPAKKVKDPVLATYIPDTVDLDELGPIAEPKLPPMTPSGILHQKLKSRRQKISSPTVGSSSDAAVPLSHDDNAGSQSSGSSQDSAKPAPSNIPFTDDLNLPSPVNWMGSDVNDVINLNTKDDFVYLLSPENSLGFEQSDDFGVSSTLSLGSPVGKLRSELGPFIVNDVMMDTDPETDLKAINPDSVLHMRTPTPSMNLHNKLAQIIQMKKETSLERPPLTAITNTMQEEKVPFPRCVAKELDILDPIVDKNLRKDIGRRDDDHFVSYVPYMWKFHDMAMTRRQRAAAARLEAEGEKENIDVDKVVKERPVKPAKIDHRKTSWMNGFMMFSRLNRRKFIQANPGVHTSHISKMMGHSWRNMNGEEQKPYKEKAKKYMQHMQKLNNTENFHDQTCPDSGTDPPHTPEATTDSLDYAEEVTLATTHLQNQLELPNEPCQSGQGCTVEDVSSELQNPMDISQLRQYLESPDDCQAEMLIDSRSTAQLKEQESPSLDTSEDIVQLQNLTAHNTAVSVISAKPTMEPCPTTHPVEGAQSTERQTTNPVISSLDYLNKHNNVNVVRLQSDQNVTVTPLPLHVTQNSGAMLTNPQSIVPSLDKRTLYLCTLPTDQSHNVATGQQSPARNVVHYPYSRRLAELLERANADEGRVIILSGVKPVTAGVFKPGKPDVGSSSSTATEVSASVTGNYTCTDVHNISPLPVVPSPIFPRDAPISLSKSAQQSKVNMTPTKYFQGNTNMVSLLSPVVCTPEVKIPDKSTRAITPQKPSTTSGRRKSPCPRKVDIAEHARRQSLKSPQKFRDGFAQTDVSPDMKD